MKNNYSLIYYLIYLLSFSLVLIYYSLDMSRTVVWFGLITVFLNEFTFSLPFFKNTKKFISQKYVITLLIDLLLLFLILFLYTTGGDSFKLSVFTVIFFIGIIRTLIRKGRINCY